MKARRNLNYLLFDSQTMSSGILRFGTRYELTAVGGDEWQLQLREHGDGLLMQRLKNTGKISAKQLKKITNMPNNFEVREGVGCVLLISI